jgi:hypothetical protein
MRQFLRWIRRTTVSNDETKAGRRPVDALLPRIQSEYAGAWVALKGGRVVDARPTPYELVASLHERDITDTTIIRVPDRDEAELVGLG